MSNEIDILSIHVKILDNFKQEKNKLSEYKNKLLEIKNSLEKDNKIRIHDILDNTKNILTEKINDIENNKCQNFYISETTELLEKYKNILNNPIKVNFMGKTTKNNNEKIKIIKEYIDIVSKYIDIENIIENKDMDKNKPEKLACKNCKNHKEFDIIEDNIYVCANCSSQQIIMKNISSYKDIDRINITSKYLYDRKSHFRDCINQYQGKQNSTIPKKIYDELEKQFELHGLLIGDSNTPKEIRFSKILKDHINIFLKELDYTKHYENVNLIHYNFTGKKPDDISHLENKLIEDFNILTEYYDKTFKNGYTGYTGETGQTGYTIDRKNFINTQYVLYQLLVKHKHPCTKEDFSMLKTIERKNYHDDIARILFEGLGWSFIPLE